MTLNDCKTVCTFKKTPVSNSNNCSLYSSTLNMSTVRQLVADLSNTTLKVPQCKVQPSEYRVGGVCLCVCM